jgi:rSAM-associated Gly-rich repeat protein
MANRNRILKTLSVVLPAGAFGASVLLALAASEASAMPNTNPQNSKPPEQSISTRLRTIRAGVSDMSGSASFDPQGDATATPAWWGNGGWGNGGWGNGGWGRWRLGWGNGGLGWGNGGWGNGGWHNGWHNGGWGNIGWGNGGWHNGWHNYWHNW